MGLAGRIRRGGSVLIELEFGGGIYLRKSVGRKFRDAFLRGVRFNGLE